MLTTPIQEVWRGDSGEGTRIYIQPWSTSLHNPCPTKVNFLTSVGRLESLSSSVRAVFKENHALRAEVQSLKVRLFEQLSVFINFVRNPSLICY